MGNRTNPIKFGPEWLRNLALRNSARGPNPTGSGGESGGGGGVGRNEGSLAGAAGGRAASAGSEPAIASTSAAHSTAAAASISGACASAASSSACSPGASHAVAGPSTSPPNTSLGTNPRILLAKRRYGREEMLAMYVETLTPPAELRHIDTLFNTRSKSPVALNNSFDQDMSNNSRSGSASGGTGPPERYTSSRGGGGGGSGAGRGYAPVSSDRGRARIPFVRQTPSTGRGVVRQPRMNTYTSEEDSGGTGSANPRAGFYTGPPEGGWANMFRKRQTSTNTTNWRSNATRDDGEEWRSSDNPRNSRQNQDRDWPLQERSQPGGWSGNRRPWLGDNSEENLPEWAVGNACASAGSFDSTGAFHGYSNDDSNLPKTQENTYPLTRSQTQGSFARAKPVEEGSDEEWWASEKAKKLSPKRFDATVMKFVKMPITTTSDNNRGSRPPYNALNKRKSEDQPQEIPEKEQTAPEGDADKKKESYESKNRSDTTEEVDRGNFQSVMINANNGLRQKHQNLVQAVGEGPRPMNPAAIFKMLQNSKPVSQNNTSMKQQMMDDKLLVDIIDSALVEEEAEENLQAAKANNSQLGMPTVSTSTMQGHQTGLESGLLQLNISSHQAPGFQSNMPNNSQLGMPTVSTSSMQGHQSGLESGLKHNIASHQASGFQSNMSNNSQLGMPTVSTSSMQGYQSGIESGMQLNIASHQASGFQSNMPNNSQLGMPTVSTSSMQGYQSTLESGLQLNIASHQAPGFQSNMQASGFQFGSMQGGGLQSPGLQSNPQASGLQPGYQGNNIHAPSHSMQSGIHGGMSGGLQAGMQGGPQAGMQSGVQGGMSSGMQGGIPQAWFNIGNNQTGNNQKSNNPMGNNPISNNPLGHNQMGNNPMSSSQMGNNQMSSSQMGNNQMGSSQMGNNQMGNNPMGSSQMGNNQMGSSQMGNNQMGSSQMGNNQMGSSQMGNNPMSNNNPINMPHQGVSQDLLQNQATNMSGLFQSSNLPAMSPNIPSTSLFMRQKNSQMSTTNDMNNPSSSSNVFSQHGMHQPDARMNYPPSIYSNVMTPQSQPNNTTQNLLSDQWYYEDPEKKIQGPFRSKDMYTWFKAGFFNPSLMVRRSCDVMMRPLGSYGPVVPFAQMDHMMPFQMPAGFDAHNQPELSPQPPITGMDILSMGSSMSLSSLSVSNEGINSLQFGNIGMMSFPQQQQQSLNVDNMWIQPPQPQAQSGGDIMWMQQLNNSRSAESFDSMSLYFWDPQTSTITTNPRLPEDITKDMKTEDQILAQMRAAQNIPMPDSSMINMPKPVETMAPSMPMSLSGGPPILPNLEDLEKLLQKAPLPTHIPSDRFDIQEPKKVEKISKPPAEVTIQEEADVQAKPTSDGKSAKHAKNELEKAKAKETTAKNGKKKAKDDRKEESPETMTDESTKPEKKGKESSPSKNKKEDKQVKKELEKEKKEWLKDGFTIVKGAEKVTKETKKKIEEEKAADEADRKKKEELKQMALEEEKKRKQFEAIRKQETPRPAVELAIKKSPWSAASQSQSAPNKEGLTLAEIQRLEREKKLEQMREQQQMMHIIAQQQAAALAREQEMQAGLGWAKKATMNANNQTLAEIQAEARKQSVAAAAAAAAHAAAVAAAVQVEEQMAASPALLNNTPWGNAQNGGGFWDTKPLEKPQPEAPKPEPPKPEPPKPEPPKQELPKKKKPQEKLPVVAPKKEPTPPAVEFEGWCITALNPWSASIDVPTFVGFLKDIESPYEVKDYVKCYLGDTKESNDFSKQFLERRSKLLRVGTVMPSDDLCSPAVAVNPRTNSGGDYTEVKGKGKKTKKNKMLKVDARILGFSVTASEDRINVGDIDTA